MKSFSKLRQLLNHLRQWVYRHRKLSVIIIGVIVTIIGSVIYVFAIQKPTTVAVTSDNQKPIVTEPIEEPEPIKYYSPLTGKLVATEADTKKVVTGAMIENSPNSRPQSGLKDSGVVFEAIAEGGITRFLVLYQQEKPKLIGPVRSVRLYDVEWLAGFDASLAHVGGSYYGLIELRNGNYRDLDQFFNPASYWRASDRYAPHNVYTSSEKLDALNKAKSFTTSKFTGFARIDGATSETLNATNIDVTISSYLYNSAYIYNKKTNNYTRYQGGAVHNDRESGAITPSVIIGMYVNETTVFEDGYREKIVTIGSGKAVIFQNGTAVNATWEKISKTAQITFKDANGKEIPLVRGQTWITAIPNDDGDLSWS